MKRRMETLSTPKAITKQSADFHVYIFKFYLYETE
jgi:hypothetical protein